MVTDITRRTLLAGLLAAPVALPAAAMGMVEAATDWRSLGRDCASAFARGEGGFVRGDFAAHFIRVHPSDWIPMPHLSIFDNRPQEGQRRVRVSFDSNSPPVAERFTSGQWLKLQDDTTPEGGSIRVAPPAEVRPLVEIDANRADEQSELTVAIAQIDGHSADVLDHDVATYAVPA